MDGDTGRPVLPGRAYFEARKPRTRKPELPPLEPFAGSPTRWRRIAAWSAGALVAVALVAGGLLYWLQARQFETTDDAFIDGHISQISSRVAGRVEKLAIEDYQHVKAGQVLLQIDPRDFQAKLDQATAQRAQAAAQLQQAVADLTNQQSAVDQAQANLRVALADLARANTDLNRYRIIDPKAVSRQIVDTATTDARSAQAKADAAQQAIGAASAGVQMKLAAIEAARANLKAADAAVENAQLQLSYTTVTAPRDGQVAKRTVELGNYVTPGQALLAVVGDDRWITANFKETQLSAMRPGQPVSIGIDACPGGDLDGTVLAMQPGSGSIFSALPAENATGNYVKVVQRVPVRIAIDHLDRVACDLAPGMSVVPSVKVR